MHLLTKEKTIAALKDQNCYNCTHLEIDPGEYADPGKYEEYPNNMLFCEKKGNIASEWCKHWEEDSNASSKEKMIVAHVGRLEEVNKLIRWRNGDGETYNVLGR